MPFIQQTRALKAAFPIPSNCWSRLTSRVCCSKNITARHGPYCLRYLARCSPKRHSTAQAAQALAKRDFAMGCSANSPLAAELLRGAPGVKAQRIGERRYRLARCDLLSRRDTAHLLTSPPRAASRLRSSDRGLGRKQAGGERAQAGRCCRFLLKIPQSLNPNGWASYIISLWYRRKFG
jgi:hypothetical protein